MYCSQKSIAYRPLVKASLRAYFTFTLKEASYDPSPLQWDMTSAMVALHAFRQCRHRARLPVLSLIFSSRRSFRDSRAILLSRCLDERSLTIILSDSIE